MRVRRRGSDEVEAFPTQNSAVLNSTVWADGLVDIPAGSTVRRGDAVRYLAFADLLS